MTYRNLRDDDPRISAALKQLDVIDAKASPLVSFSGVAISGVLVSAPLILAGARALPEIVQILVLLLLLVTFLVFFASAIMVLRCIWIIPQSETVVASGAGDAEFARRVERLEHITASRRRWYLNSLQAAFAGAISMMALVTLFLITTFTTV